MTPWFFTSHFSCCFTPSTLPILRSTIFQEAAEEAAEEAKGPPPTAMEDFIKWETLVYLEDHPS